MKQALHKNKSNRAVFGNTAFILALVLAILILAFIVFYWIVKNP